MMPCNQRWSILLYTHLDTALLESRLIELIVLASVNYFGVKSQCAVKRIKHCDSEYIGLQAHDSITTLREIERYALNMKLSEKEVENWI